MIHLHSRVAGCVVASLLAIVPSDAPPRFTALGDLSPAVQKAPSTVLAPPEPPAPARIEFVRVLTPSDDGRTSVTALAVLQGDHGRRLDHAGDAQPYGIAVDPEGRVLVADTYAETIHSFDPARNRYSAIRVNTEALIGVAFLGDRLIVTDSVGRRVFCASTPKGQHCGRSAQGCGFERPTGRRRRRDRLFVVDTLKHAIVERER